MPCWPYLLTLLLDSGVFADQQLNERPEQRFAALAHVVHTLEEPQGEWEFLLGYAPMRAQPTPQERPEAFHGVHVHLAQAVPVFIAGKLASPMVDLLMPVSPGLQTGIKALLVRIHQGPGYNRGFDERCNGLLLPIGQQLEHHLPTALHHAQDREPFLRQGATTRFAFASVSPSCSPLVLQHFRQAFMAGQHLGFVALHLIGERHRRLFLRSRHAVVPSCAVYHCHGAPIRGRFARSTHCVP